MVGATHRLGGVTPVALIVTARLDRPPPSRSQTYRDPHISNTTQVRSYSRTRKRTGITSGSEVATSGHITARCRCVLSSEITFQDPIPQFGDRLCHVEAIDELGRISEP